MTANALGMKAIGGDDLYEPAARQSERNEKSQAMKTYYVYIMANKSRTLYTGRLAQGERSPAFRNLIKAA